MQYNQLTNKSKTFFRQYTCPLSDTFFVVSESNLCVYYACIGTHIPYQLRHCNTFKPKNRRQMKNCCGVRQLMNLRKYLQKI